MKDPSLECDFTGDEQLMNQLVRQRSTALRKLYKRYQTVLHAVAMRVLHDETDTEEVLQDVFVQLWQKPEKYCVQKGKPLGWLITLALTEWVIEAGATFFDGAVDQIGKGIEAALPVLGKREACAGDCRAHQTERNNHGRNSCTAHQTSTPEPAAPLRRPGRATRRSPARRHT